MKKITKKILIVLFSILTFVIFLIYSSSDDIKKVNEDIDKKNQEEQVQVKEGIERPIINLINNKPPTETIFPCDRKINLIVFDKNYEIGIDEESSVFEAMDNLQRNKENNFSFKYKEYSSLGIFIDELNEIKSGSGKYWIYSVNGKEASIGVSKYLLKEGDIIKWELK